MRELSLLLLVGIQLSFVCGWGRDEKVLLRDVQTLTLRAGQMTTGRRNSPIPQLKCVGGKAGCGSFIPDTVQCYNKGFDGRDVQWECKADINSEYKFGQLEVLCEGYDYPDDPYILAGSCGLEYTMEYRNPGFFHSSKPSTKSSDSSVPSIIAIVVFAGVVYFVYTRFISPSTDQTPGTEPPPYQPRDPRTPPPYSPHDSPDPPGFKSQHTAAGFDQPHYGGSSFGSSASGGAGYGNTQYRSSSRTYTTEEPRPREANAGTGFGNFWTGAATGGVLGYLFGSRNQGYANHGYGGTGWGSGWGGGNSWGSGWGGGSSWGSRGNNWGSGASGWGSGGSGWSSGSGSTTSTTTGFASTRRR